MSPLRPGPSSLALVSALLLATGSVVGAQTPIPFDPQRRLVVQPEAKLEGAEGLEGRLRQLEQRSPFRYRVVIVSDPRGVSLHRFALELRSQWSTAPGFDAEHTFILVCATAVRPRVALVPPRDVADRLALSLARVERALVEPFRPRADLAAALYEAIERADGRLTELEDERLAERTRRVEGWAQLNEQVRKDLEIVSDRLTNLELRCLELGATGLDVTTDERRLQELRRDVADVMEQRGEAPEPLVDVLRVTSAALAEVEANLARLEDVRRDADALHGPAIDALDALDLVLKAQPEGSPVREAARRAWNEAAAAIGEATKLLEQGRPVEAMAQLQRAEADLERTRRALEPPPAPEAKPTPLLPWLLVIVGVGATVFGVGLLRTTLEASQLRNRVEATRESTARLAQALETELAALRTLHLSAGKPAPVAVPEALRTAPAPSVRAYSGDTAAHLARARGRVEDLHDTWRQLEQALARSDAARAGPGGLAAALDVLERAPSRKLPVGSIREAAQVLERVAAAPAACGRRLEEAVRAAVAADALLERVLEARQSAQPFEDDVADLWERAREAALAAQRDPIGAALLAGEAVASLKRLEERVERTLELSRGLGELRQRLGSLPAPVGPPQRVDAPHVVAWAHHLADEVAQALDEGARDEATRELDRALALTKDCELLLKGAAERPDAELGLLREDLHQAHKALDELRAEFTRPAWDDVEVALLRAAARIELIALDLQKGGRLSRLQARMNGVRTATLLATTRLLQLRGERERALGLIEELENRARAIENYLGTHDRAVSAGTRERLTEARAAVGRLAGLSRAETPPRWDELHLELAWLSDAFDLVREQAGREVHRHRRVQALRQALEKGLRDADDIVRRFDPQGPGAAACVAAAREAQTAAVAELEKGDLRAAMPLFQRGLRLARDAREMAAPRLVRASLPPGPPGDAAYAVLRLRHAFGRAHRAWILGLATDPVEVREQLAQATRLLATEPTQAIAVAVAGIARADAIAAAAHLRDLQAHDALVDARHDDALDAARARHGRDRAQRKAELHRRTRFEVLVLGEEELPAAAVEQVDIDAGDDSEELAALEDIASAPTSVPTTEVAEGTEAAVPTTEGTDATVPTTEGTEGTEAKKDEVAPAESVVSVPVPVPDPAPAAADPAPAEPVPAPADPAPAAPAPAAAESPTVPVASPAGPAPEPDAAAPSS